MTVSEYKRTFEYRNWRRLHTFGGEIWKDTNPTPEKHRNPSNAEKQAESEYLVGEVAWLREGGLSVPLVCEQVGKSAEAVGRMLARHGRADLAAPFYAEAKWLKEREAA